MTDHPTGKPTISDVARRAGVSTSLVSFVLNGRAGVAGETRARIQSAIAELGYIPNPVRRHKPQPKRTLALVLGHLSHPLSTPLVRDLQHESHRHGYSTIILLADDRIGLENTLDTLGQQRCEGIFVWLDPINLQLAHLAASRGLPVVRLHQDSGFDLGLPVMSHQPQDLVRWDYESAIYRATSQLLEIGHRRIGILTSGPPAHIRPGRIDAYRQAFHDHGITVAEQLIVQGDVTAPVGFALTAQLLDLPEPPTALIAAAALLTVGALHAITAAGLRVPEDLSVIGMGNPEAYGFGGHKLTVIPQHTEELARTAVDLMIRRIKDGPNVARRQILIDIDIEAGESVAPPRLIAAPILG